MLTPPIVPMLARPAAAIPPRGRLRAGTLFDQKLDGFRVIAFIRSGHLTLQSRSGADLTASFPDLSAAAAHVETDLVADGELVVFHDGRLDFSELQGRARRKGRTAAQAARLRPAHVIFFDLLEAGGRVLLDRPLSERRAELERLFTNGLLRPPWTQVTATTDRSVAEQWLTPAFGRVGIEGTVVKADAPYRPGVRGWTKVRAYETSEGVVAGVTGPAWAPGTLLLGRYDREGDLRLIARTTPLTHAARQELGGMLAPAPHGHPWQGVRFSAGWGTREALVWLPVAPDLVAEIRGDTAVDRGGRFRHPVRFLRVRADLSPSDLPLIRSDG